MTDDKTLYGIVRAYRVLTLAREVGHYIELDGERLLVQPAPGPKLSAMIEVAGDWLGMLLDPTQGPTTAPVVEAIQLVDRLQASGHRPRVVGGTDLVIDGDPPDDIRPDLERLRPLMARVMVAVSNNRGGR